MNWVDQSKRSDYEAPTSRGKAAFFDVDGTLTSEHTWKGMIDYFRQKGTRQRTHRAYLGLHYPLWLLRRAGLISEGTFRAPWAAHLAWYIRGYSVSQTQEIWDCIIDEFFSRVWRQDMLAILNDHLAAGDRVMLVSSGPASLIERIAEKLGAQHAIGTRFRIQNGRYTGSYLKPVCIDRYKASLAWQYFQEQGVKIDLASSTTYADSIADLPLLEMVGNPIAVYPDEQLSAVARHRGWKIIPSEGGYHV